MSLSQFLEPIEPSPSGVLDVRRRAQRRSLMARLIVLGGSVMPALLVFALGTAFLPGAHNQSSNNTTVGSGGIMPDSSGLPGGSVQTPHLSVISLYLMLAGLLLVILGNVWSLTANRRDAVPLLWPTRGRRLLITVGLVVTVAAGVLRWIAG